MRRIWIALLLSQLPFAAAQEPPAPETPARVGVGLEKAEMSLAGAIARALEHNLDISIERTVIEEAVETELGSRGFLDPKFRLSPRVEDVTTPTASSLIGTDGKLEQRQATLDGSWDQRLPWWGSSFQVSLENSRESTSNPFEAISPYNTARLGASVTLPLTRNRSIDAARARLRISSKQVDLSDTQFEVRVIAIVSAVQEAYWNLVAARQDVVVTSEAVSLAREQLTRTQRMIDSGTLAPVELAAAEAELERRVDTWYASIGTLTQVENALKLLLGAGADDPLWDDEILPTEESTLDAPEFPTVREAVDVALADRPELRMNDLQRETNEIQTNLARNQTKAAVSVVGGYTLAGLSGIVSSRENPFAGSTAIQSQRLDQLSAIHGLDPLPTVSFSGVTPSLIGSYGNMWEGLFKARYPTVYGGLQIDFTARNREARSELSKTAIAERRIAFQRDQLEQAVAAEVRNALQAIQTARQRITASEASVRAAQEKLDSEIRLFRTGESTNFLVLTRQNELSDSRRRAIVARLDFNKAVARAQQALGSTLRIHNITLDK